MLKSFHFIPADNKKFIDNNQLLRSDAVIYDLEDSVPLENKEKARSNILNLNNLPRYSYLRVNELSSTEFIHDYELLKKLKGRVKGVVVPKYDGDYRALDKIKEIDSSIEFLPLIESFKDLSALDSLLRIENVYFAALGLEDMFIDIPYLNENLSGLVKNAESRFVRSCYANNVVPIHIISTNTKDLNSYRKECLEARLNGFQGKLSIHPNHIDIINEVFRPNNEELDWAKDILDHSKDERSGYFMHDDGVLTTPPKIKKAKNIIENE